MNESEEFLRDAVVRQSGRERTLKIDLEEMRQRKDAAYEERNRVVAVLARIYPSGIKKTAVEGWNEEWHGCVYIDMPFGQLSWHYHDSQAFLFEGLPPYTKEWDGTDTETKYAMMQAWCAQVDGNAIGRGMLGA